MQPQKISIIIPVYNEENFVEKLINRVEGVVLPLQKEIIIIDDGSKDGTSEILKKYSGKHRIIVHDRNYGKGRALRTGFAGATGDIVIVQDADLEYNPQEYPLLIQPILDGDADVVYGSRFVTPFPRRVPYFSHYVANQAVTFLSNMFTGLNLSDMETCYKVFTKEAVMAILPELTANRFGIEPEITARIAKHNLRVYEVGVSYRGRTYEEGKKIGWKDGVAAIWHIIRYNILTR